MASGTRGKARMATSGIPAKGSVAPSPSRKTKKSQEGLAAFGSPQKKDKTGQSAKAPAATKKDKKEVRPMRSTQRSVVEAMYIDAEAACSDMGGEGSEECGGEEVDSDPLSDVEDCSDDGGSQRALDGDRAASEPLFDGILTFVDVRSHACCCSTCLRRPFLCATTHTTRTAHAVYKHTRAHAH